MHTNWTNWHALTQKCQHALETRGNATYEEFEEQVKSGLQATTKELNAMAGTAGQPGVREFQLAAVGGAARADERVGPLVVVVLGILGILILSLGILGSLVPDVTKQQHSHHLVGHARPFAMRHFLFVRRASSPEKEGWCVCWCPGWDPAELTPGTHALPRLLCERAGA